MADLGNYELNKGGYSYTAPDPQNSKLKGLMTTDYDQLKKDLIKPGELQINKSYDQADYKIRDNMGGKGLYGSSIYGDTLSSMARNRADSHAMNTANAGATVEQLRSQNNQWLGNAALDESRLENTWYSQQDQLNKALVRDIIMGSLGNKWSLGQLDKQGEWKLKNVDTQADADEKSALWSGLGSLAGGLLSGFDWF